MVLRNNVYLLLLLLLALLLLLIVVIGQNTQEYPGDLERLDVS